MSLATAGTWLRNAQSAGSESGHDVSRELSRPDAEFSAA